MRVWRNVNGKLEDAAINPGNLVFLFSASAPPVTCPLPASNEVDYIVKDNEGWSYATDAGTDLIKWPSGAKADYQF